MKTKEDFLRDIMLNSDHHAKTVMSTFASIYTAMCSKNDLIMEKWRTNILWFTTNKGKYVVVYNHKTKQIEFRNKNQQGKSIATFDDTVPVQRVWDFVTSL